MLEDLSTVEAVFIKYVSLYNAHYRAERQEQEMHGALLYAGYLNHGTGRDLPEVSFYATTSITPQDLETRLSDMHSKGSTMSCAVVTGYLGNLIDSDSAMAIQSLLGLDSVYGEERFARLIGQLLSAGARIAQQIPDMKSTLDE